MMFAYDGLWQCRCCPTTGTASFEPGGEGMKSHFPCKAESVSTSPGHVGSAPEMDGWRVPALPSLGQAPLVFRFWIFDVVGPRFSSCPLRPAMEPAGHSLLIFNCV